ncbi:MAG: class I SAM-dependent methyltransferase [Sedimenticola sp.]
MGQLVSLIHSMISGFEKITAFRIFFAWAVINFVLLFSLYSHVVGFHGYAVFLFFSITVVLGLLFIRSLYLAKRHVENAILEERKERKMDFYRREQGFYQNFDRDLSFDEEQELAQYWSECLGREFTKEHIRYLCNKIKQIESTCHGRLACNIQDAIIHVLIAESLVDRGRLSYLELGCLHGINAVLIHQFSRLMFDDIGLLLIDPLDGYYAHGVRDPYTGLPVSERVLLSNFRLNLIQENSYVLIKDYSFSELALREASKRKYNYIFVDGDHSLEGIKSDCELYIPLLENGGFIIIDDYNRPDWPDVTKYVNECLIVSLELEYVGHASKTVVFRKKAA